MTVGVLSRQAKQVTSLDRQGKIVRNESSPSYMFVPELPFIQCSKSVAEKKGNFCLTAASVTAKILGFAFKKISTEKKTQKEKKKLINREFRLYR